MSSIVRNIVDIKAVGAKSKTHSVTPNGIGFWVESGASGERYHVRLSPIASCNCKWGEYRPRNTPSGCSHVQSVIAFEAAADGYSVTARASSEDVSHLHRKTQVIGNGIQVTLRRV